MVSSCCSTRGTNRDTRYKPRHEYGKFRIVIVNYLSCLLLYYVAGALRSNQAQSFGSAMKRSLLITFVVGIGKYVNIDYVSSNNN